MSFMSYISIKSLKLLITKNIRQYRLKLKEVRYPERAWSRPAAPSPQKELTEVVRASDQDVSGTPSLQGVLDTSVRTKTLGRPKSRWRNYIS